jgi:YHS domain-containing protein
MKTIRSYAGLLASALALSLTATGIAHEAHKKEKEKANAQAPAAKAGTLVKLTEKDAKWAEKERKAYPLDVCLTSDEKLGSMGENAEFIYRVQGKPDRLLRFCCAGCEEDFLKEPAKYLAKLDSAAKQKRG